MGSVYDARPWLKQYPARVPHELPIGSDTAISDFKNTAARAPETSAVHGFDQGPA